ncbi:DNA polymerase II [Candidatus Bathyarchaeota archaeon]|nr:DNA polymerase II [Candidatus Bathyarchaeota archaeon]
MTSLKFYLLDVDSRFKEGGTEVRLWGLTDDGRPVVLFDKTLKPYFYAVAEDVEVLERHLKSIKDIEGFEVKDARIFGKTVKAFKIYVSNPDKVDSVAEVVSKLEGCGGVYDSDLRHAQHYLLDYDAQLCGWHVVEVEPTDKENIKVDEAYRLLKLPTAIEYQKSVTFRVLAFYMVPLPSKGSPKPERDRIACLAIRTSEGYAEVLNSEKIGERALIEKFIEIIDKFDPDIVVGYGINARDWEYLTKRAEVNGLKLNVGRDGTEPHRSLYGHISVAGRIALDLYDYAEDIADIKIKTLENLATYLGLKVENEPIEELDISKLWSSPEGRKRILDYVSDRCKIVMESFRKFIDYGCQLSNLVCIPLDHVCTAAVGFRVESYLMKCSRKFGELIPKRVEKPYQPYAGAIVLEPKPGLHENIAVLDFRSMYPSIMMKFNISPDTYVEPEVEARPEDFFIAPEVGHRFLKKPDGFYRDALKRLLETRAEINRKLKTLSPDSAEYRILDARQKAIKVITNAMYGYAGWIGARWYRRPIAESTTAWGREALMETVKYAMEMGLPIIYGDTDSIFVKYDQEKIEKLVKYVSEKLGLEIKPETVYKRIIFTEAKKRYAGLLTDGRIDITGLEAVRGDWPEVAKKIQREVVRIVLETGSAKQALEEARKMLSEVEAGKVPIVELIIWKTLTKTAEDYKVKTAHVKAAQKLADMGWDIGPGDKVGTIIVKGTGRLYDRVEPYQFVKPEDVDYGYYIENQIIPAILRILSVFGYREEDLKAFRKPLEKKGQRTLF